MITTGEARRIAEAWVRARAGGVPGLVGVIVGGSTRARDAAAPHPAASDVDLFFWIDGEVPSDIVEPRGPLAPRKLLVDGVVLEPSFHDARRLADPEAVLGDLHLAPAFADPLILLDPAGRLRALSEAVRPGYRRRRHVRRRLDQALEGLGGTGPPRLPDLPGLVPCLRNAAMAFGAQRAALAVLVAGLRFPTSRRAFVVAREVLAAAGREELGDALLRLLGTAALGRAEVEALVEELEQAYDAAVAVRRTPIVMEQNVSADARALERAGIRELVDAGHHREAGFPLLLLRTVVQGILENDAGEERLAAARSGYRRLLAAVGLDGDEAFLARGMALRALLPELRRGCEEVLARAPGVEE